MKYLYISVASVLTFIGILSLAPIASADTATDTADIALATVDVTPATITIDSSSLDQTYDGNPEPVILSPDPLLDGYTAAVTYEGDTITGDPLPHYGPSAIAPTDAGTYTVKVDVTGPSNYSDTITGTLTIDQAPLTFTVDNQSIQYGDTPTPYPYVTQTSGSYECANIHVDGLKGSDQITMAGCVSDYGNGAAVTANATPGTYPIEVADTYLLNNDELTNNYKIDWVLGTMTVTKAAQVVTFDPLGNKTVGDADFDVSASATTTSGLDIDFTASGSCTVSSSTVHLAGAGSCTITAHQDGNNDYNAAPDVSQTFTVNPSPSSSSSSSSGSQSSSGSYYGGGFSPVPLASPTVPPVSPAFVSSPAATTNTNANPNTNAGQGTTNNGAGVVNGNTGAPANPSTAAANVPTPGASQVAAVGATTGSDYTIYWYIAAAIAVIAGLGWLVWNRVRIK
jgi:hypothetical protein